jgi:hypothetical protein
MQTADSVDAKLDATAANETTETLNRISGRTTLVDDLKSCAVETDSSGRQIVFSVTIVKIR